jgi:hypothetical protein
MSRTWYITAVVHFETMASGCIAFFYVPFGYAVIAEQDLVIIFQKGLILSDNAWIFG